MTTGSKLMKQLAQSLQLAAIVLYQTGFGQLKLELQRRNFLASAAKRLVLRSAGGSSIALIITPTLVDP